MAGEHNNNSWVVTPEILLASQLVLTIDQGRNVPADLRAFYF